MCIESRALNIHAFFYGTLQTFFVTIYIYSSGLANVVFFQDLKKGTELLFVLFNSFFRFMDSLNTSLLFSLHVCIHSFVNTKYHHNLMMPL